MKTISSSRRVHIDLAVCPGKSVLEQENKNVMNDKKMSLERIGTVSNFRGGLNPQPSPSPFYLHLS